MRFAQRPRLILLIAVVAALGMAVWVLGPAPRRPSAGGPVAPVHTPTCDHLCPATAAPASAPGVACHRVADAGWTMYGHDAQRTSASPGCIGVPAFVWRYVPVPTQNRGYETIYHAVATSAAIYVEFADTETPGGYYSSVRYLGAPAIDRIDTTGSHRWTFEGGRDVTVGIWPLLLGDRLLLPDDGIWWIATGDAHGFMGTASSDDKWDVFGDAIWDPALGLWFQVNTSKSDGPGLFVRAYRGYGSADTTGGYGAETVAWQQLVQGRCYNQVGDITGGIAEDGGTLIYAPHYDGATTFASGVYAFSARDGSQVWHVASVPQSRVSASAGSVYLIEGSDLVSRSTATGAVRWRHALDGASSQAPVLAGGAVITADAGGVVAFSTADGHLLWKHAMDGAAAPLATFNTGGGCGPEVTTQSNRNVSQALPSTTLAAALGSDTLVVTGSSTLCVLGLKDGHPVWCGTPTAARGRLRDPIIVDNRVYVCDDDGLIALQSG